jgi:hypothetical protein
MGKWRSSMSEECEGKHELEIVRWVGDSLLMQCVKCGMMCSIPEKSMSWERPAEKPKLWKVQVEGYMLVYAADADEAADVAFVSLASHSNEECGLDIKEPVEAGAEACREWASSIPFSSVERDEKRSVKTILEEG